jgi:hypothetical protein
MRSQPPSEMQHLKDFPRLTPLGSILLVEHYADPTIRRHVEDLARIPQRLLTKVKLAGLAQIHFAARPVPDLDNLQFLRGVHPRGWQSGTTWDSVPGAYNADLRVLVAGIGIHGSSSLVLHEFGHALGDLLGYDSDSRLVAAHQRLYSRLNPYLQQDGPSGPAGRQELLAEGFADVLFAPARAAQIYDARFVQYVETVILQGRCVP